MKTKNLVVVITGSTKGLGHALKSAFIIRGNKVIVAARFVEKNQSLKENDS